MKLNTRIRKNYDRKQPTHDYLKFWRVIRYFIKAKYGLTASDLDIPILFNPSSETRAIAEAPSETFEQSKTFK